MHNSESPVILGVGNALVDIVTPIEQEDLLRQLGFQKGSMNLVDFSLLQKINQLTAGLKKELASGGSTANTMHGLAHLGVKCGFFGKVGKDELGDIFRNDLHESGVIPSLLEGENATGRAIALISPDSERTFATYLGAAIELSASDLQDKLFKGYQYMHLEGYLVQNHDLVRACVKFAQRNGLKIALDLASFNVVEANRDFLLEILEKGIDIVFANEDEARAISHQEPCDALHFLGDKCRIAVVKLGKDGSLVKCDGKVYQAEAFGDERVDTTGAGDLFASGFLYGLINNYPLDLCARIGSVLAGHVIRIAGARLPEAYWDEIRNDLKSIGVEI
ncbi:MAG: adenosine kinase [Bacteroidota bacterium]|nr:adenosine kinase [Bacteroidota bacterium]MDP4205498.1 adenosine kinase [Bacteroidota bacterium]